MDDTEIFLDWDVPYAQWVRKKNSQAAWVRKQINELQTEYWYGRTYHFWYRRSSNGRVHIRILTDGMRWASQMSLRAILMDDRVRLYLDLCRNARGEGTNRIWDAKYSKGRIRKSGRWFFWFRML